MKTQLRSIVLVTALLALLLAACSPQAEILPGAGTPLSPDQLPEAVMAAQSWLAEQLGFPVDQVEIVSFDQEEWTDSCLGLGGPAESCLQAVTPGYRLVVRVGGQEYEVRTDATGTAIRSPQVTPAP